MEKIYSKVDGSLLHLIFKFDEFETGRINIIPPNEFIQCSALKMNTGKTFKPHRHVVKEVTDTDRIAQESWVVMKGMVKCEFYDIDDTVIAVRFLDRGDASFTLRGGHNYEVMSDNTLVYEYKTGKYEGQSKDKVFIYGKR